MNVLETHPSMRVSVEKIGIEKNPIMIIDDFIKNAERLIDDAESVFFLKGGAVYPGVRGPVPPGYAELLLESLGPEIERTFNGRHSNSIDRCAFSMITVKSIDLSINQRVPHTDENDVNYLAFVHYLCRTSHGGTNFYRHRETGYERIFDTRASTYNRAVSRIMASKAETQTTARYFREADQDYDLIHSVTNVFNRLIIYSGANLHSGDIRLPDCLSEHPRHGRLTVTGFLPLRPGQI